MYIWGDNGRIFGSYDIRKGVATDASKTEAMNVWPTPKTMKQLRGFLGLTGYYRRFIKDYGSIVLPQMLKKDQFGWSLGAQTTFENMKKVMVSITRLPAIVRGGV